MPNVEILSLPTLASANADPGPKRLMLPQGEFTLLHPACPEIRFLAFLTFAPGISRGGHHHPAKEEFFYLLRGSIELRIRERVAGTVTEYRIKDGDLVRIPPGVEHLYTASEPSEAVEFSATPWSAGDSVKGDFSQVF
jgi:mannose-6-phosphate isomerase-like protein (cupin superfamily)